MRVLIARLTSREVLSFLAVGGTGYVVDVVVFNVLLSSGPLVGHDPVGARVVAMLVATVVTYLGNRSLTWRTTGHGSRLREMTLFAVLNLVGLGISVIALVVSHDLLGLTARWQDNVSANVVGVGLGMLFRFWSYRRFVFRPDAALGERPQLAPSQSGEGQVLRPSVVA